MTTDLATLRAPKEASLPAVRAGFFDLQSFELIQRVSKAFAGSDLVPKQYQGNLANCMIAMDMAQRIGANPLMVMQNLYIVHGTPGWSSKFLIATINACGRYSSLRYERKGKPGDPGYGCRAWAIERETNERLDGIWVTWEMVRAEGWDAKNGSKWKTMPDQMFVYRSASFWQRAYAPELGMGLQTAEEIHDVFDAGRGDDGRYSVDLDALRSQEKVDKETGEVTNDILGADSQPTKPARKTAGQEVTMTFAKVASALESSKDRDTLDIALDMIRLVADEQQREELASIGRRVASAIEAAE